MSYTIDKTGDVIIKGFEQGISDDPYAGISDIRNINLISIPKEASVNFSTAQVSPVNPGTGTMTSANAGTDEITYNSLPTAEARMAIVFSSVTGGIGISTGVVYWIGSGNPIATKCQLYTDLALSVLVNITGTGTGTFTFYTMTGYMKYFTQDNTGNYYGIDSVGRVWTNASTTPSGYWCFTGNITLTNANGNGIVAYSNSSLDRYIFAFRNGLIDYIKNPTANGASWVYGWNPADGSTGNTGTVLKTTAGTNNNHEAIVAPDNKVYFTDGNWVGRFYQASPTVDFVPTTTSTYVFDQTAVLPFTDIANCLAPLGNTLLVGGSRNVVYPWDTFSQLPSYPMLLAENYIQKMVTVNTNTFIFAGNRGRIYITNGSQAQLYKKIPDHLSGTVEPYFQWGGACSNKNQLFFSALASTNAGVSITAYGGVWAIDLDSKALRLTNKLSYGTYAGYATALIPVAPYSASATPAGTGLLIGWQSGTPSYGIDGTSSSPYSSGEAYIDSDLIPIGTFLKPTTNGRVEFKLSVPLVANESIKVQYRQAFSDSFTDVSSTVLFNSAGIYSGVYQNVPFQNSQWIQLRVVLTSTSSSPSYCRLTEIRLGN